MISRGNVTERQADQLYAALLRDPTAAEWITDPMESMTFLLSDHVGSMERWFEIIIERRDFARALDVSELLKRHRFYSSLPLGGRLLAFRWLMESPTTDLSKDAVSQRNAVLKRFVNYQQLKNQTQKIRTGLLGMSMKYDEGTEELQTQVNQFVELSKIAKIQEAMLASVALRRQPAEMTFPPTPVQSNVMETMGENEIALIVVSTRASTYLFGQSRQGVSLLGVFPTRRLETAVGKLIRELMILEKQIDFDDLAKEEKWKTASNALADTLLEQIPVNEWPNITNVVIVPDGVTWYLPWEVLRVGADDANKKMLAELVKFRYAPTLGLAYAPELPYHRLSRSALFAGKLHGKAEDEATRLEAEKLLADLPTLAILDARDTKIPSGLFGAVMDRFVVWSDVERPSRGGALGTYAVSPIQLDQGRNASSLAGWLSLPFDGVDQIIMPGFVSDGGGGKAKTGGNDLFLMTTGLLASGVRTVGISRWTTGGQSSMDFCSEFIRQNKTEDAVTAWNNTIANRANVAIDLAKEPRFKPNANNPLTAEHPLFWAGMIIVDMPAEVGQDVDPDADPVAADAKDADAKDAKDAGENAGADGEGEEEKVEAKDDQKQNEGGGGR